MADTNVEAVGIYTADISQLGNSFEVLMRQISEAREELRKCKAGTAEYNATAQKLRDTEIKLAKSFKDNTTQIDKNTVSYRQLNDVLKDLRKTYKEVGTEEERQEITQGIQAFDKELKSLDANIGQYQRNVGNYEGAITSVSQVILGAAGDVGLLDKKTANLFIKLTRDIPKLTSSLTTMRNGTEAAGRKAEEAGAKATKSLTSIISKLGAVAVAVGVATLAYKLFQSEIDRAIRKAKDWGKELLGINDYTINNAKAQKEFASALAQSTAQIAGQITTYKILDTLVNNYALSTKNAEKAASELLKALKETDTATNRAKVANGEYTDSIDDLVEALYKQAEAGAVVEFMTNHIKNVIDMQNQIIQKQLEKNAAIENKEAGRVKGFWNALKVGIISNGGDIRQAIDAVNDGIIDNIDKDIDEIEGKIKEAKEKLPKEFKELMEALFPEGDGGNLIMEALFGGGKGGSGGGDSWYSKIELQIKEIEAKEEDYWKFSKKGYNMYLKMYDEIANHYKSDAKKHKEALIQKMAFQKQYQDYMKKLAEADEDYGKGQYERDINELERWKAEQIKIYESAGKETTNLLQEYNNRKLKIEKNYADKYADINKRTQKYKDSLETQVKLLNTMAKNFNRFFEDWYQTIHATTNLGEMTFTRTREGFEKIFETLKANSENTFNAIKDSIYANADITKAELEKQRDDEKVILKEKLGDTEEYKKQEAELIAYYDNKINEIDRNAQNEATAQLRAWIKRQLDYLDEYHNALATLETYGENGTEKQRTTGQRDDWNGGWGRMGQTTDQDSMRFDMQAARNQYDAFVLATQKKMEALRTVLDEDTQLSVEERLSIEEEYFSMWQALEDEKLIYARETEAQMLELEKQTQQDKLQAWQESIAQIGNLLGALEGMYEADVQAQLKAGEITQEQAEKQLEKYRGVKAAAATMDALASAVGAYNSMASIPYVGPALGAIAAAAALAAGYANVRQILATKKDGSSNASTQYQQVTPVAADYNPTYVTNVTGEQETEQLANAMQQTPIRAIVVESEVTAKQELAYQRSKESTY